MSDFFLSTSLSLLPPKIPGKVAQIDLNIRLARFHQYPNRYALQLLTPASIIAQLSGRTQIEPQDVGEMHSLFLDSKRSATLLREQEQGNRS